MEDIKRCINLYWQVTFNRWRNVGNRRGSKNTNCVNNRLKEILQSSFLHPLEKLVVITIIFFILVCGDRKYPDNDYII